MTYRYLLIFAQSKIDGRKFNHNSGSFRDFSGTIP